MTNNKSILRKIMCAKRNAMLPDQRAALSRKIAEHVLAWPGYRIVRRVFIYASMVSEVDTWQLISAMLGQGKSVYLPRVLDLACMEALPYRRGDSLTLSRYGVLEPLPHLFPIKPEDIELVLVPALAVTTEGWRLGYGGGYYDRFLGICPAPKMALCFSMQIVDSLPVLEYDVRMDALATEHGVCSCLEGCL